MRACDKEGIHHKQFYQWKEEMSKFNENDKPEENPKMTKCTLHRGPKSQLDGVEDLLLEYIFEKREQGMNVSVGMAVKKASKLDRIFKQKTKNAKSMAMHRFVRKHGLVHRVGTHESQKNPEEVKGEAMDFMKVVRKKVRAKNRSKRFTYSMDQTPIFFTYHAKKTLEKKGMKTVNIRKSTGDTRRSTLAATVTASGEALPPMVVVKGAPKGRICTREFPSYPEEWGMYYAAQKNAWMDEDVMLRWVDEVLAPDVKNAPEGIVPILFLDSYRCHMMKSVVNKIEKLGVEVEHIPGGCTGLVQPVDVGINKPLKNRIKELWDEWMDTVDLDGDVVPPSRRDICEWVAEAYWNLDEKIIQNSWLHKPFNWF